MPAPLVAGYGALVLGSDTWFGGVIVATVLGFVAYGAYIGVFWVVTEAVRLIRRRPRPEPHGYVPLDAPIPPRPPAEPPGDA